MLVCVLSLGTSPNPVVSMLTSFAASVPTSGRRSRISVGYVSMTEFVKGR